jgi:flavin-dependent dehydrogenase
MMNIPKHCDVAVIGGGPAGSSVATLLSQKGYDVVLFDKVKHPRYQVGESLIPHFWKYCDYSKVSGQIQAEGFLQKAGGTVVWDGVIRQIAFKDFGYNRPALHVERDRFDYILLEHSREQGTQVFEEVTVLEAKIGEGARQSVIYRPNSESTPGEITCRFVVDASGQSALIARQLGIRILDQDFRFMSAWGYFKNSKYVALDGKAYSFENVRTIPPTTLVSSTAGWGWAWHIPLRESTSVGLILPKEEMKTIKDTDEALEAYFLRRCKEIPYLNRLLEEAQYCEGGFHAIRDYSYRPKQLAGPGFFLIGDAAAFIDPIFSEGCLLAFYSAYLTSWAIDRSFKHPNLVEQSRAICASQFAGRYEVGHALALPRYGADSKAGDMAKKTMEFESILEQELMHVVSTVTTRSENFRELAQNNNGQKISSNKFRKLEEIVF